MFSAASAPSTLSGGLVTGRETETWAFTGQSAVAEYGKLLDTWALVSATATGAKFRACPRCGWRCGWQMDVDASFVPFDALALRAAGRG
jgi:hypothetical protein